MRANNEHLPIAKLAERAGLSVSTIRKRIAKRGIQPVDSSVLKKNYCYSVSEVLGESTGATKAIVKKTHPGDHTVTTKTLAAMKAYEALDWTERLDFLLATVIAPITMKKESRKK